MNRNLSRLIKHTLWVIMLLALTPSASAQLVFKITAPSYSATTITISGSGTVTTNSNGFSWNNSNGFNQIFGNSSFNYVNSNLNFKTFSLTGDLQLSDGVTPISFSGVVLDDDTGSDYDDFALNVSTQTSMSSNTSYTLSGSSTFDMAGTATFGDLTEGTYAGTFDGLQAGFNNFSTSDITIIVQQGTEPNASEVSISGATEVGEELTGSYTFSDPEGDSESGSTYKWYRSDDESGTNKTAISGAVIQTYTTTIEDENNYISFEVTPSNGTDTGSPVESSYFGPIDPLLRVESITHLLPSSGIASASDSVTFRLEFNGPATNVTTDDFIADSTAGGTVSSVNMVNNKTYDVKIKSLNSLGGISKLSIKGIGGASATNDIAKLEYSNGSATISQTHVDDHLGQSKLGQSFKATTNNYFTALTLYPRAGYHSFSGSADLKIYSGNEDDGGATLLTSQTINITSSTAESGQSFTVENPPELTSGQTYSFIMDNWSGSGSRAFSSSTNGNYGNGRAIFTSNNSGHTNFDLKFEIFEGTQIAGSVISDVGPETNEMFTIEPTPPENLTITGNEGWRMMSSPVTSTSFGTLLDTLWTQGFPGSDSPEYGSANIFTWSESTQSWVALGNASDVPVKGSGFIMHCLF